MIMDGNSSDMEHLGEDNEEEWTMMGVQIAVMRKTIKMKV